MSGPKATSSRRRRALSLLLAAAVVLTMVVFGSGAAPASADPGDPGAITGTVTSESTGLPLDGIWVEATDGISEYWGVTDEFGSYVISILEGTYTVQFHGGWGEVGGTTYLDQWFDGASAVEDAQAVDVTSELTVPDINAALALPPSISGTVVGDDTGLPVSGLTISAYNDVDYETATTAVDGSYTIEDLEPGSSYTVKFGNADQSYYLPEFWENAAEEGYATAVDVGETSVYDIDASLASGGRMSGTVTDEATALPISGADVGLLDADGSTVAWTITGADGGYTFYGLTPASYQVYFAPAGYIAEYYDHTLDATLVGVSAGATTDGIDAAMETGGSISGTVTDEMTGDPLENIEVVATSNQYGNQTGYTDSDGNYTISGLLSGDYDVSFNQYSEQGFNAEWFDGVALQDDATPVSVENTIDTPDIDASLTSGEPVGGSISGTVTDELTGLPIYDVMVTAVSDSDYGIAFTDEDGNYTVTDLDDGDYVVFFEPCGCSYEPEFYDDAFDPEDATLVPVVSGVDTPDIDAALAPNVSLDIRGTVTDKATGLPVADAYVDIYDDCGCLWFTVTTDENGEYVLDDLPAGDYKVFVEPLEGDLAPQWYSEAYSIDAATVITVTDTDVDNIDLQLVAPIGTFKGRVTNSEGERIRNARAHFLDEFGNPVTSVSTSTQGNYSKAILSGTYKIMFTAAGYDPVYNGGFTNFDDAPLLTLDPGTTLTENATVQWPPMGTLKGNVANDLGVGIPGARVYFLDASGGAITSVSTSNWGNYSKRIPAGTVKIKFTATGYVPVYNGGAATFAEAPLLDLQPGASLRENATLLLPAIFGVIIDGDTGDPVRLAEVLVFDATTGALVTRTTTSATGWYEIQSLPAGSYKIRVQRNHYLPVWWGDGGQTKATAAELVYTPGDAVIYNEAILQA